MTDQEDRDRLIKVETDVSWIRKKIDEHMKEHFLVRMALYGALISSGLALIISLI